MSKKSVKLNQLLVTKSLMNKLPISDVEINSSEFKRLTAAEKLNNSKYRSLIYRTYPNEPTCGCKSAVTEQSTNIQDIDNHKSNENFLVCPGGCKKSCCSRPMQSRVAKNQDNGNYDKVLRIISTYCVENQPSNKVYNSTYCLDERMRGGGGVEEENCECSNWRLTEYLKNVEDAKQRSERFTVTSNCDFHKVKTHFLSSKFCHQTQASKSNDHQDSLVPDCVCLKNKESLKSLKSFEEIYREKKCIPVKCLTRKLKEAYQFVDSHGKALNLPKLDVIDSVKTPCFKAFDGPGEFVEMLRTFSTQSLMVNSHCGGPCNSTIKLTSTSPRINATPFTIAVPGIVQEAIIPGAYRTDNYETSEWSGNDGTNPCRKPKCRARRKKIVHKKSSTTIDVEIKLNKTKERKSNNNKKKKQFQLKREERRIISSSLDGFKSKNKPRKILYVYSRGKTYPGFIYGHKNCNDQVGRVPRNMGWFWTRYKTAGRMKPRVGWKPGTISRQIREMMKNVKDGLIVKKSQSSLISLIGMREKKLKSKTSRSLKKDHSKKLEEKKELKPPPTLHIQRREGVYFVTMYPVKKKEAGIPKLNESIKPFQVKIITKKNNSSVATNSTASDMEIEFSPPTAINRYKRKPDVVHVETQVKQQEIIDAFELADDKKKEKKGKKKKKDK